MKIIMTDNFCRDSVADILIAENIVRSDAEVQAETLNIKYSGETSQYSFVVVPDNYILGKGLEDILGLASWEEESVYRLHNIDDESYC